MFIRSIEFTVSEGQLLQLFFDRDGNSFWAQVAQEELEKSFDQAWVGIEPCPLSEDFGEIIL